MSDYKNVFLHQVSSIVLLFFAFVVHLMHRFKYYYTSLFSDISSNKAERGFGLQAQAANSFETQVVH